MAIRLLLVVHATTSAPDSPRFDALDAPALARANLRVARRVKAMVRAPEQAAADTVAGASGLPVAVVEHLWAAPDFGAWSGRRLPEILTEQPHDFAQWLRDPDFAGHGGESLRQLHDRIASAMATERDQGLTMVVAGSFAVRAAALVGLGLPPQSHHSVTVSALTGVELSQHEGRWTLTAIRPYPQWCQPLSGY